MNDQNLPIVALPHVADFHPFDELERNTQDQQSVIEIYSLQQFHDFRASLSLDHNAYNQNSIGDFTACAVILNNDSSADNKKTQTNILQSMAMRPDARKFHWVYPLDATVQGPAAAYPFRLKEAS
jgi:hypothetical protein